MLRSPVCPHTRRGSVLVVVLAMLVLFAVIGLSFVLYSESQLSSARSQKLSVNQESDPNPLLAAETYLGGLVYDVGDTGDDLMNPIRGHSLARSKYGYQAGTAGVLPYTASPIAAEPGGFNFNGITDSRQIVRFTWDTTTGSVFDPERYYNGAALRTSPAAALTGTYAGKNYAFTYPDRHDYYLAWQDPNTGRITLPSFHRPDLGSWDPNSGASYFEAQGPAGKFKTLRPRRADGHVNFPLVPMNADGTYTGDVQNMAYTAGVQHNDSFWMDAGGPVLKWRGKNYKAMVAPLVLDLSSRVNLSVAGNRKLGQTFTGGAGNNDGTTGGSQGLGPWEIDPQQIGLTAADVQALIARRQGGSAHPPRDPYTALNLTTRINGLNLPPAYSSLDPDGDGTRAFPALANDSFTLPVVGGFSSFPQYTRGGVTRQRYPTTPAEGLVEVSNHPAQFNPLGYARGTAGSGGFGHDDLVRLLGRYSDPKGRNVATTSVPGGLASLTPVADTPAARQTRALSTTFNVSQIWGSVTVATNSTGGTTTLGPVDLNRPLPDYRKNPALPLSPLNIWPVGSAEYNRAHAARHTLARDIFVRLAAGLMDGTNAVYDPATGNINFLLDPATNPSASPGDAPGIAALLVDYIDNDDLITPFVWRPVNPSADPSLDPANFTAPDRLYRLTFGAELPRLVINEGYGCVANTRDDPLNIRNQAQRPLRRRYWFELHNPTPPEPADSPARSEGGAARLRYEQNVTRLPDPLNPTGPAVAYTAATFNPYRLEVLEVTAVVPGLIYRLMDPLVNTATVADLALRVRINNFVHDATAPSAAPTLGVGSDELNLVRPVAAAAGGVGRNEGYYLIGPRDQFPAGAVPNTLSLPDPAGGVPTAAAPVNALTYDVTVGAPADSQAITTQAARPSYAVLRRLLDPYHPEDTATNFNSYVTVDFLENIPTRDRAANSGTGVHTPSNTNAPSIGRRHPYAHYEEYGNGPAPMVVDQVNTAATPPHTFFRLNDPADNARGTGPSAVGFEWLVHPDRELVSLPEAAHVMLTTTSMFTHYFFNVNGQYYTDTGVMSYSAFGNGLLETGSRQPGVPLGGREPGRVNLNTVNHDRVVNALFGSTTGNGFGANNPGQQAAVWGHLSPATPPVSPAIARSPNRVPAATSFEGGQDRPLVWGGRTSSSLSSFVYSPLYRCATDPPAPSIGPYFFPNAVFRNPNAPFASQEPNAHFNWEPLQKIWNNSTAVSDGFLVLLTVTFVEVENAGPWGPTNPPVLGRELFDKVEGDLRAQFGGVLDRSQLATRIGAVDPTTGLALGTNNPVASDPANNPVPRAVQSKLTADAPVGGPIVIEAIPPGGTRPDGTVVAAGTCAILGDGIVYTIQPNTVFRVGYGDSANGTGDGEWVGVVSLAQRQLPDASGALQNVPGQVTINIGGSTQFHGGSSPVGNVLFGNPGPQRGVTLAQLQARGLMPYFTRLDP